MTVDQFPPSHKAWDYTAAIHPNFYAVLYQIFKISQPSSNFIPRKYNLTQIMFSI